MARLTFRVLTLCVLAVVTPLTGCGSSPGPKTEVKQGTCIAIGTDVRQNNCGSSGPSATPSKPVCAAGLLQLVGSSAFQLIAQEAADEYMNACRRAKIGFINPENADSAYGLSVLQQAVDSGSPSAGSMIAMYDGLPSATETAEFSSYPIGLLIFWVVAHTGLFPGSNITTGELVKIFGTSGEQGKVAVGRPPGSGTRLTFFKTVLGLDPGLPQYQPDEGGCPPLPPTEITVSFASCTIKTTGAMLRFVDTISNAIGYAEVTQTLGYSHVSELSIDGYLPTQDNVRNGFYKFWTVEHLYSSTQPTALTKDFLAFLPNYIKSILPPNFIACSAELKRWGANC